MSCNSYAEQPQLKDGFKIEIDYLRGIFVAGGHIQIYSSLPDY